MEGTNAVLECKKRTQVRWEYVLEPLNKATYWDHQPLPTEERRALARRTFKVGEHNEKLIVKKDDVGDVLHDQPTVKVKESRVARAEKILLNRVRCAERGVSAMLLWQHEFYYVLEQEELSRRKLGPPKPYLYQAIGDIIRVVRPKLDVKVLKNLESNDHSEGANADMYVKRKMGYGVKFTFDLPVGKSVGIITVRACWHDIVFRNSLGFTEIMFLY
jgi:hypothetical protein